MATTRFIAVIDIGKTNAKVVVFDLVAQQEVERMSTANIVVQSDPYPYFDTDGLWNFIISSLKALGAKHTIDAISTTTHGASAALLNAKGALVLPVLDYEHDGPQRLAAEYDAFRPAFDETGSPRLPNGLNLGAQIYWQAKMFPQQFANVQWIVTYPQYWSYRLCGVLANEATSLGCHTDLWDYAKRDYSSLVGHMGWRKLMPPLRMASDCLGALLPEIAQATGLGLQTKVYCGIHDSNASILPHLLARRAPFGVVSTGTWVICMAIDGSRVTLDPSRDALVNVSAFGEAVPSARFMGGREYELLGGASSEAATEADGNVVMAQAAMLLPSVVSGCGPFPGRAMQWQNEGELSRSQKHLVVSWYLALMTATCLDLVGAAGSIVVEGPFTINSDYLQMLATASGRRVIASNKNATGTTSGAALLCGTDYQPQSADQIIWPTRDGHLAYAAHWKRLVGEITT